MFRLVIYDIQKYDGNGKFEKYKIVQRSISLNRLPCVGNPNCYTIFFVFEITENERSFELDQDTRQLKEVVILI